MLAEILELVLNLVFELLGETFFARLCWVIMFPVIWTCSLPFILVLALFRSTPFLTAFCDLFAAVHQYWLDQGSNIP